ncbi:MAG TPA: hypothetical protein VFS20_15065 [Longimicrobium sp.]|nr:hypothetical protein [Longimicrobium sp.]
MAKLKLDLQQLRVESFAAQEVANAASGTVRAREITQDVTCGCQATDLAHTCTCGDNSSNVNACFCTDWESCRCEHS